MKISLLLSVLGISLLFNSCNTIAGAGDDISETGDVISGGARRTHDHLR